MKALLFLLTATALSAVEADGLKFEAPGDNWKAKETPANMSQGGFVFSKDGVGADADIFFFGAGQGGDVEANVARWKGRFEGEPEFASKTVKSVGGKEIVLVTLTGVYLSGPAFGEKTPQPDSMLLGAIIPGKDANVFIRMAGPKDLVAAAAEEFEKLAVSAR